MGKAKNEQRREIELRNEAQRVRTEALFDAYPDMIFRVDGDSRILDFHAADQSNLVAPPEEFLGRTVSEVFDPEFAASAGQVIRKAIETKEIQIYEYSLELHGETMHFEARIVPSDGNEVLSIVRDITSQQRARVQLSLTQSRLNQAQAVAKIGSWERDLTTNEAWWSDETHRLLGVDPQTEKASYEGFLQRVHPEDRGHVHEALEDAVTQRRRYFAHVRLLRPDGGTRTVSSQASVVLDSEGRPGRLVGTIQDVTERVELEREILAIGERERERVGRDLHDGLGQTLTGISLSLKALTNRLQRGQAAPPEMLHQLERNVQEAMDETRRVARLLSPRMEGLRAALETLVKQFDCDGLRCTVSGVTHHAAHDAEVETHLYRIAQEAVSNAVKHGNARHIELRYNCNGRSISLEVHDDGIGLRASQESEGSGLRNMQYRVHMISGKVDVEKRPGGGTRVICACPCRTEHDEGHDQGREEVT